MTSTTLYLFLIFIGLRAAVPFQFEPWERKFGIAAILFGATGLTIRMFIPH